MIPVPRISADMCIEIGVPEYVFMSSSSSPSLMFENTEGEEDFSDDSGDDVVVKEKTPPKQTSPPKKRTRVVKAQPAHTPVLEPSTCCSINDTPVPQLSQRELVYVRRRANRLSARRSRENRRREYADMHAAISQLGAWRANNDPEFYAALGGDKCPWPPPWSIVLDATIPERLPPLTNEDPCPEPKVHRACKTTF